MKKHLNWGIVGFGAAGENFLKNFNKKSKSKITAISSKSRYNLLKNCKNINIFKDYEEVFKSNVDIVYVPLVNSLHQKLIKLGIKYNKHILVEKPSCQTSSELEELIPKFKKKKLFLKESILYLNHPLVDKIIRIINKKLIGSILNINCTYGFNFAKNKYYLFRNKKSYKKNIFSKRLGGGAIYNYAHYPLSAINIFSPKNKMLEIENFVSKSFVGHTGVDEYSSLTIKFKSGLESKIKLAINKDLESSLEILGEHGSIYVNNPWTPENKFEIKLKLKKKGDKIFSFEAKKSLWSYEINSIEKDILKGKNESTTRGANLSDSLIYLKIIDKWRKNVFKNK